MAEWIGHTIANWPGWLIIITLIIVAIIWIIWQLATAPPWGYSKYEWPEDKKKRLQKAKKKTRKG